MAKHVGAWAHAEHGLGMHVYTPANRDAPTNMINNALSVGAVHKLRFAQDLILYNLDLDDEIEGFDGQAHIAAWQEDPIWQKTRENVEKLTATRDWSEAFFATAVVFEPLDRRAVPQRLRDAGRRAAGRLRHPDAVRLGRVGHHARAARGAAAVRDARQRRAARRGEQADDAGLAGEVDAGEHRGGPHDAADLVAARREGDHGSRSRWSARASASATCSRTSDSRPPRRREHGRRRPQQVRPDLVQPGRRDADEQPGRPRRSPTSCAGTTTSRSRSCRR